MSLHSEIAEVAFQLYKQGGKVHGHDLEHWLEAERIVREKDYVRGHPLQGKAKKTAQPKGTASLSRKGGNGKSKTSRPKGTQRVEKRTRAHKLS